MKIITINVNGIRAAEKKGLFTWLEKQNADVVCLQEIKAMESQLDERFYPKNMYVYYHSAIKKGYSGTAIYCKKKPNSISFSPWQNINDEGRLIQANFDDLTIASIYIPSGSNKQQRQDFKMEFINNKLMPYLKDIKNNNTKYIFCGDWNIAHKKIDIKNWRGNQKNSGFLPEERAWLDKLYDEIGYIDAFREINKEHSEYTWWSNRGQSWANNTGWRIDYQIISPNLMGSVKSSHIYKQQRFSDHAPLIIDYAI